MSAVKHKRKEESGGRPPRRTVRERGGRCGLGEKWVWGKSSGGEIGGGKGAKFDEERRG